MRRAVLQREQQADERVQPGVRVADAVRLDGLLVGMPGQPGEPGRVLDDEGERRVVPPRPVEPEAGHAHHDEVGRDRPHGVEVEADLVEHPRRVVLDDDVARGDELAQQLHARARSARSIVRLFLLVLSAREDRRTAPTTGPR